MSREIIRGGEYYLERWDRGELLTRPGVGAMKRDLRNGKIAFIDDEAGAISSYMDHLRGEGYTNLVYLQSIRTLSEVVQHEPDLIFLDIAGVATNLDADDEGVAILRYVRRHCPWTRVVVLSGSTFKADRVPDLAAADKYVTKASLGLADLVELTEEELEHALCPEWRNARILGSLRGHLDSLSLSGRKRRKLEKLIGVAVANEGNEEFEWAKTVRTAKEILRDCGDVARLLGALA